MKTAIEAIVQEASLGFFVLVTSPFVWIVTFVMFFTWIMQMYWINDGLTRLPSVYVISCEITVNQVMCVTGSILYFKTPFASSLNVSLFFIGLLMGIMGVVALSYYRRDRDISH